MKKVSFKKLDPRAKIPQYMTPYSAGLDLCIILDEPKNVFPGEIVILSTGLALEMDRMTEGQVRPRSGLSLTYPNYLANSPGTIDSDYRGEIKIPFVNNTNFMAILNHGDRIAQLIFSRVYHVEIKEVEELSKTLRDTGGFGHTGL